MALNIPSPAQSTQSSPPSPVAPPTVLLVLLPPRETHVDMGRNKTFLKGSDYTFGIEDAKKAMQEKDNGLFIFDVASSEPFYPKRYVDEPDGPEEIMLVPPQGTEIILPRPGAASAPVAPGPIVVESTDRVPPAEAGTTPTTEDLPDLAGLKEDGTIAL